MFYATEVYYNGTVFSPIFRAISSLFSDFKEKYLIFGNVYKATKTTNIYKYLDLEKRSDHSLCQRVVENITDCFNHDQNK